MPEYVVMYGDSPVGRLKCSEDFVSVFSNRKRMELSGGFTTKPGMTPELVELFVSPIASPKHPTLTDEEREAVEHGLEQLEPYIDTESRHSSATLRKLLDRLA